MTLRVPTGKSASVGMRKLAEDGIVKRAMETLKGKARIKRTMWSRRAQEYEAKINSGDLIAIAEVVRDLYRSESQPEQSYSERQLYEAALDRMAREIAAVEKLDERGAVQRITEVLSKSAKGRRAAAEEGWRRGQGGVTATTAHCRQSFTARPAMAGRFHFGRDLRSAAGRLFAGHSSITSMSPAAERSIDGLAVALRDPAAHAHQRPLETLRIVREPAKPLAIAELERRAEPAPAALGRS